MKPTAEEFAAIHRLLSEHCEPDEADMDDEPMNEAQVEDEAKSGWSLMAAAVLFLALAVGGGLVILDAAQAVWEWLYAGG